MASRKTSWQVNHRGERARLLRLYLFVALGCFAGMVPEEICCQDLPNQQQIPGTPTAQTATVHGIVRNGATGEPLPHALVRINGDAATGMLTDGDGRFEIADLPTGPQDFMVIKPGFIDKSEDAADSDGSHQHGYGHNVIVVAQMGDVVFTMVPLNSIEGTIQLSTGDAAEGIQVSLLRRNVQDGRVVWQTASGAKTDIDGVYRFGELSDGLYAIYTEPAMDSNAATNLVANGKGNKVEREGYACTFYPDVRNVTGAAKIRVEGGEQAQANITLTLEPFHAVAALATMPRMISNAGENVGVQVADAQGQALPYPAQFDAATHMVQAELPDGSYTFLANMQTISRVTSVNGEALNLSYRNSPSSHFARGEVGFSVAGRAVSGLQLAIAESGGNSIQVILNHNSNESARTEESHINVTLSQTGGGLGDGIVNSFAEGSGLIPLETQPPPPGAYWVHTAINGDWCEASFTAGGASLGREQLVLNSAGSTAPLVLTLRDDCAGLTIAMPDSVGMSAGEEPFYTVYVVPDFDSTVDVVPQTLRPSTGGRIKLAGLTPGGYHVYTFERPMALAYRDRAVLASLPSQAVTLAPGSNAELTLEAPQP